MNVRSVFRLRALVWMLLAAFLWIPQAAKAQKTWYANVGAESQDQAKQADAFLPNELWIHANDSIQWTFVPQNEQHTVTFLTSAQPRPAPPPPLGPGGCPGITPDVPTPSFTGASCVTSAPSSDAANYTVSFPTPGNYKLVCLIHTNMNGTVHVLPGNADLPFNQSDYFQQASDQARDLINDSDNLREEVKDFPRSANEVIMRGEIAGTGGGRQYLAIVRFFPGAIHIKAGETVEWTNLDPTEPHTVTFGIEPPAPQIVTGNTTIDPDGALHATISASPSDVNTVVGDAVNSGFLQAAAEDAVGRPQSPVFTAPGFPPGNLGLTRIRITFSRKGVYNYKCALHDVDGMLGTVVVE